MILSHEWSTKKSWIIHIPTSLSELFEEEDIKRLIRNLQQWEESVFFHNLKLEFSKINKNWTSQWLLWEELYRILNWLIHFFETQIKIDTNDLSFSTKVFAVLTWTLEEKENQIQGRKNILQRCKLYLHFFGQNTEKYFHIGKIDSLLSEHIEELKKKVYSRKQEKWRILEVDENVIYAKFD